MELKHIIRNNPIVVNFNNIDAAMAYKKHELRKDFGIDGKKREFLSYLSFRQSVSLRRKEEWFLVTQEKIAEVLNIDVRTVRRYTKEAIELGLIVRGPQLRRDHGWYDTNRYQLSGKLREIVRAALSIFLGITHKFRNNLRKDSKSSFKSETNKEEHIRAFSAYEIDSLTGQLWKLFNIDISSERKQRLLHDALLMKEYILHHLDKYEAEFYMYFKELPSSI
jgi:DNA-binding MarR family transcriptional regulator